MAHLTIITPDLPFPPTGGGKIKSHLLLRHLAAVHDVSLVSVLKGDDGDHVEALRGAVSLTAVQTEPVDRGRGIANLMRSVLAGKTLNEYRSWSPALAERCGPMLEEADVIIADHLEAMQYVPERLWPKTVLHTHNAEHLLWRRYSKVSSSLPVRAAASLESRRIASRERRYGVGAGAVLATTADRDAFRALGVDESHFFPTFHIGDDATAQLPDVEWTDTDELVFFLGTLTWEANADGLVWFLEEVWPLVVEGRPDARFVIGGKNPPAALTDRAGALDTVDVVGFVADPEVYLRRARVIAAPLRFGSGMKLKVVEGLMRGIPTVTTTVGAESIEATDGIHLEIADSPADQASRITRLLADRSHWEAMRDRARALARTTYTWDVVTADAQAAINHVLMS